MMTYVIKPDAPVLVLRTCGADMISEHGFTWPELGPVAAPDWQPTAECGQGLHGLLWGEGDGSLLDWSSDAEWIVVEVGEYVDLKGKIKFPRGNVVFCGSREAATAYIAERAPAGTNVVGGTATAGYRGTATAGYRGTAAAGDDGTAAAGYRGTAMAGDYGTATAGYRGTAAVGDYGTAMAGDDGTAAVGDYGTATAGYRGTAMAGDYGTATVGDYGTATAGYRGTATAGYRGTAAAGVDGIAASGVGGMITVKWYDVSGNAAHTRVRVAVGYVGENGIEPNTAYRYDCGWVKAARLP